MVATDGQRHEVQRQGGVASDTSLLLMGHFSDGSRIALRGGAWVGRPPIQGGDTVLYAAATDELGLGARVTKVVGLPPRRPVQLVSPSLYLV